MRRPAVIVILAAVLGSTITLLAAPADSTVDSRLRGGLSERIRGAAPDEMIPINIVLRDRVTRAEIALAAAPADKAERRAAVVAVLKQRAAATNRALLDALRAEQAAGLVGERIRPLWLVNLVSTEAAPAAIRRIAQRQDVEYVMEDRRIGAEVFPVLPPDDLADDGVLSGGTIECGVAAMRADEVWATYGITGEGVVVGIIDTGCCITHPDLENQIWINEDETPGNGIDDDENGYVDDIVGYDFRNETGNVTDTNGHGTHTSGSVVGDGTNGEQTGMAPGARLMILKFWNDFAGESVVWEAMQYAVDNGAHIITASIGWPHSRTQERALWREESENAMAAGVFVNYAAGNEGGGNDPDNVRTPGDVPELSTVGATDCNMNIASFSSRGPITWQDVPEYGDWPWPPGKIKPSYSGPGVNTLSTSSNCSGYLRLSGTSMATPHLAGAAALVLQANPALDHFGVKEILEQTAIDRGAKGKDNTYGAGFVDAFAAVELALASGQQGDVDGDGDVDFKDLLLVLKAWGPCEGCPEDVNGDGVVDFQDILVVLSNWS